MPSLSTPASPTLPRLYGLDIETDTSVDGFDPSVAAVVSVAVSGPDGEEVFDLPGPRGAPVGDGERQLLADLDRRLAELSPGIIVTWNGGGFDLPFLAERAGRHRLGLGLDVRFDPTVPVRRPSLSGRPGAYRATWRDHRHLDAYRVYRSDVGPLLGVSCGLKTLARVVGLVPVEVDRDRIHELSPEERRAYVSCDARLTRLLAERRWPGIAAHVDRT